MLTTAQMTNIALLVSALVVGSSSSSSTPTVVPRHSLSASYHFQQQPWSDDTKPLSLKSGVLKLLQNKWERARRLALLEQTVEDYNAEIVATAPDEASALASRMSIVLPLDDRLFDPPPGVFSHGHVQTGDKMSLPQNFWGSIVKGQAEVPWLFEVSRIPSVTSPRDSDNDDNDDAHHHHHPRMSVAARALVAESDLNSVVGGALDFRAPPNYVFLPHWMMHALQLKPLDVVAVRMKTTTPPGASVKLRPHSAAFAKIRNHQAVLETELKHYSALVKGATIPFDYLGTRYYFDVVDLRGAPRNEKVTSAKVQDCDLVAEFVRSKEDVQRMKEEREERRRREEEDEA